jgi:hypothetical protein
VARGSLLADSRERTLRKLLGAGLIAATLAASSALFAPDAFA